MNKSREEQEARVFIVGIIKYILQVLAAVVYSGIVSSIVFIITVLPEAWLLSLSWWKILLIVIFLGGILFEIIHFLYTIVILPFVWIHGKNFIATACSVLTFFVNGIILCIKLWQIEYEGTWHFICLVLLTSTIVTTFYIAIRASIMIYLNSKTQ